MRKNIKIVSPKFSSNQNASKNATNYLSSNIGIIMIKIILLKRRKIVLIIKIWMIAKLIISKIISHKNNLIIIVNNMKIIKIKKINLKRKNAKIKNYKKIILL